MLQPYSYHTTNILLTLVQVVVVVLVVCIPLSSVGEGVLGMQYDDVFRDEKSVDLAANRLTNNHNHGNNHNALTAGARYYSPAYAQQAVDDFNTGLQAKVHESMMALWNYETNITDHTSNQYAEVSIEESLWRQEQMKELARYKHYSYYKDPALVRMLKVIHVSGGDPNPTDEQELRRMVAIGNEMTSTYSSATYKGKHLDPDLQETMESSRDADELLDTWLGWRAVSGRRIRSQYDEYVKLLNKGAKEHGFTDYGQFLRLSGYESEDMALNPPPGSQSGPSSRDIEADVDELWVALKPMYAELHAYVRRKLAETYPQLNIDVERGKIPAHLLGNMWAQEWGAIYDLVVPYPDEPNIDVTPTMETQAWDVDRMFHTAEDFFVSLGLEPMTQTFWSKSMFVRPEGRDVVCHASAEDFFYQDDFRIKMCAGVNQADLQTIHHEMGHVEYFMLYKDQPAVYRKGANSGFHEAVGDTIALSVMTPRHLQAVGLLEREKHITHNQQINFLMKMALNKIAFLPFGLLIDKYRWDIYRENIDNSNYNSKWWEFRSRYQGLEAPAERTEQDFDAGAKFHVAQNVPYVRYFISFILQFQFHETLCRAAGVTENFYDCDIYGSKQAGALLRSALSLGDSQHWKDVLEQFTGSREISAQPIQNYFRPLTDWLQQQNRGHHVEWDE